MKTILHSISLLCALLLSAGCGADAPDESSDLADDLGIERSALITLPTWDREGESWDDPCSNPNEATVKMRGMHYGIDVAGPDTDWFSAQLSSSLSTYGGELPPHGTPCSGLNWTGNLLSRPAHAKDRALSNGKRLYFMVSRPDAWTPGPRDLGWFTTRTNWSCASC